MFKLKILSCCFAQALKLAFTSLLLTLAFMSGNALADEQVVEAGDLVIEKAFSFATPPGARAAGGYLTITNRGSVDDVLTGGSSSFSDVAEVHEMKMVEGVMKMRHLEQGLKIPAGETITLTPGGLHMMFMGLTQSLSVGARESGSLIFFVAGEVPVEYDIVDRSEHMANSESESRGNMNHDNKAHGMKHDTGHANAPKN